ncbi:MAG TPA: ABC transporter permease [Flavobacterium sp.]|nr:ABC transporter permease [Flavobacterium sp.]
MGFKLMQSIIKELRLLFRDVGGLITLFLMPILLVIMVTSIQDSTYQSIGASKIPILWVDHDQDSVSFQIKKELTESQNFELIETLDEKTAQNEVFKGNYQMAVVLPKNLTSELNIKIRQNVDGMLDEMGLSSSSYEPIEVQPKEIRMYFDPATQLAFKNGMKSSIDKMILQLENQRIYQAFEEQLGGSEHLTQEENFISFQEIVPKENNKEIIPNSVQHNVPAWTLFAVFFIIIPLSINIVKEKNQGTYLRILSSPTSHSILYLGKIITYLVICLMQFYAIILVAKLVFPLLKLPDLEMTVSEFTLMSLMTLVAGFTAISLGILIGIVARTQEQSAPFGATLTVILAAVGGVWIPVFAMSEMMQLVSKISPMNWALNGYYDILLRKGGFTAILPEIFCLFLFSLVFLTIAFVYDKKKRTV